MTDILKCAWQQKQQTKLIAHASTVYILFEIMLNYVSITIVNSRRRVCQTITLCLENLFHYISSPAKRLM